MKQTIKGKLLNIVGSIRCDKCEYWQLGSVAHLEDSKFCVAFDLPGGQVSTAAPGTFTAPDFFCAMFERRGEK